MRDSCAVWFASNGPLLLGPDSDVRSEIDCWNRCADCVRGSSGLERFDVGNMVCLLRESLRLSVGAVVIIEGATGIGGSSDVFWSRAVFEICGSLA